MAECISKSKILLFDIALLPMLSGTAVQENTTSTNQLWMKDLIMVPTQSFFSLLFLFGCAEFSAIVC